MKDLQREVLMLKVFKVYQWRRLKSGLNVSDARLKRKAEWKVNSMLDFDTLKKGEPCTR
jgi:hypothetical protein